MEKSARAGTYTDGWEGKKAALKVGAANDSARWLNEDSSALWIRHDLLDTFVTQEARSRESEEGMGNDEQTFFPTRDLEG